MIQAIKRLQCFLPICRRFSTSLDRVTRRGVNRVPLSISVGEVIDQFTLTHSVKVHPTNSTLLKFIHESGLRYYHIDSSSIDNTFAILVRNSPMDDSSVSYVLEKMLQCGCNKYRVKDAVEEMKNRSFNSTNQIVTTDEYFCFPFTTHTSKDFYNLIDVYMHMVFSPQLQYSDFLEVCGRFKFQNNNINN
jgi:Zn-dependent M16 (insulinase) family peptidase